MEWIVFALLSAAFYTASDIYQKKVLMKQHSMNFLTLKNLVIFVLIFPILLFLPKLNTTATIIIFFVALLNAFVWWYWTKGLRHTDISIAAPLAEFAPLFVLIFAFFFLGERPNEIQMLGILLVVAGTYFLQPKEKGIFSPFKKLMTNKYTLLIVGSILLEAIVTTSSKYIIGNITNFITYFLYHQIFLTAILMFAHFARFEWKGLGDVFKKDYKIIIPAAIFGMLAILTLYKALSLQLVALVVPIVSLDTLFDVVIGGKLFHEKDLIRRTLSCIIVIIGVVLII